MSCLFRRVTRFLSHPDIASKVCLSVSVCLCLTLSVSVCLCLSLSLMCPSLMLFVHQRRGRSMKYPPQSGLWPLAFGCPIKGTYRPNKLETSMLEVMVS